jgi:hypothetical protein
LLEGEHLQGRLLWLGELQQPPRRVQRELVQRLVHGSRIMQRGNDLRRGEMRPDLRRR